MKPTTKFQRRRDARPAEIVAAALEIFAAHGFAAARLDEIAARAGVSKGTVYLYFPTKEALFEAVLSQAVAPNVARVAATAQAAPDRFDSFLGAFARLFSETIATSPVGAIAKMVIGESRSFPILARRWHDAVVAPAIATVAGRIAAAQRRGEVRAGDPRLFAVQLVGPFILAILWRETFVPVGAEPFDLAALAEQHVATQLRGLRPMPEDGS